MFKFELKPGIRKQMKDPDLFIRGQEKVYWGIIICGAGMAMMLFLYFAEPEKVLRPSWILPIGIALAFWGEWEKYKGNKK